MTSVGGESLSAWLRLTLTPGISSGLQRQLLRAFGLPEHVYDAGSTALRRHLDEPQLRQLLQHDASGQIEASLDWAAQPGNHVVTLADEAYPKALLDIPDPPTLLYITGDPTALAKPMLAIVGSRHATAQGLRDANAFADTLSQSGLCIVSGLALGIDGAAHQGALKGEGGTVAVIGTGADRIYPARHHALARSIVAEGGALVSEFPLGSPPRREHFPRRNRLIAGLSLGVLVVEAAPASGSLITARLAGEQGREVFAIPGSIHSPLSRGCHQLIRQGAKLVESAADILEELRPDSFSKMTLQPPREVADSPPEGSLLGLLDTAPMGFDEMVHCSGLTAEALSAMLLQLELEGKVASLPGGRYQRLI